MTGIEIHPAVALPGEIVIQNYPNSFHQTTCWKN
jgi:hypothetical protein